MDNDLSLSLWTVLAGALAAGILFAAVWAWGNTRGRISVIDVAWGGGFALVSTVAFVVSGLDDPDPLTHVLLWLMPAIWGLRLAVHTGRRLAAHDGEDPRYESMIEDADSSRSVLTLRSLALPQAGAMVVVSLPITLGSNNQSSFWPLSILGVLIWAVGVFFEAVGDWQLERFKADPDSSEVMDQGLWRYTRHPNYFGDVANWWGIWLVAAASWPGLLSAVGPALMTYTIIAKTGSALTEKNLSEEKPEYADYVERTSAFFPLPPRKKG